MAAYSVCAGEAIDRGQQAGILVPDGKAWIMQNEEAAGIEPTLGSELVLDLMMRNADVSRCGPPLWGCLVPWVALCKDAGCYAACDWNVYTWFRLRMLGQRPAVTVDSKLNYCNSYEDDLVAYLDHQFQRKRA